MLMIREYFGIAKTYMLQHRNEMVITGVMFGVFATIAVLATGDISEAIARSRKR